MKPNSKNVSKSQKRKRKPYIAPKPQKPKLWNNIARGLSVLRHRHVMQETKVSFLARKLKNPAACVVAPIYAAIENFGEWSTAILENIFKISDEVHRFTLQQLKLRVNSSYPIQCVCPTFLLNDNKVTILLRPNTTSSPLRSGPRSSLEDSQVQMIDKLASDNHGVIFQCTGKTFSLWKDKDLFYVLMPEGFPNVDSRMPTLLKSTDLRKILESSLQLQQGACSLYTLKVLNKVKIPMTLENINEEFKVREGPELAVTEETRESIRPAEVDVTPPPAETPARTKKGKKTVEEPEPIDEENSEDLILALSSDYKELSDNRGILVGKEYCKDPDRIPHTIIAAAIFLHNFPANIWTSLIIHDIMKLGKRIFFQSEDEDLLDNEDWMARIKFPIKFNKTNFSAKFDKVVFGKVTSVEPEVLSVEKGLMKFFEGNDTGILVGPQMVLVWQQKNNFFMFDPKERDGLGRKWTRLFSSELGSTALAGSACVTLYRNPKKLAEVYVNNIALKHRNDPFRIVKIRFYECIQKSDDEGNWIATGMNKWILVGTKTLCDYSYADDPLRAGKAICVGVSALMNAIEQTEDEWGSETVDKVLSDGIEIFKQSLASHDTDKPFTLQSTKTKVEIGGKIVRLGIIDCKFRGPMAGEDKSKDSVQLKTGLNEFFKAAKYGIFTVKDIALALWRGQDNHYYLFYPYEKIFTMPPQCLCENESSLPPMGVANALRFKTPADIVSFLTTYLNTKESDEYCLSLAEISLSAAASRPALQEYQEFGSGGAIMRPLKDLHEGHEIFGVRADRQTLANLLIALGFNRINSSINWNREDLADILKIGDKIFCRIYMGLPECQAREYKLEWEDVVPVIGINKFTFTRDPIEGVLEIIPEVMGEELEYEMGTREDYANEEGIEAQDEELFVRPQGSFIPEAPPGKDLRGVLQLWDKKNSDHHEAVLESDFYKIAIWKRDGLYFVFDPKASGENGELTERRIEMGKDQSAEDTFPINQEKTEDIGDGEGESRKLSTERPLYLEKRSYTEFNNDGTAYTAWFSNFDEFFNHISGKTPQEYKYGKFTLHDLVLRSQPVGTDDFEYKFKSGYRAVAPNHSILRGSMTQNNPSLFNRGKQEWSNCIVAIAFAKITPSNKMTTTLLDVVLKYGDRLHTKSLNALKPKSLNTEKLYLNDISSTFTIYQIKFKWRQSSKVNGNLLASELKKATAKIGTIETGTAMILSHKDYIMAFWRSEGGFYLYDPFETNPNGMFVENGGLPSLSKFNKLDNLLNYLLSKFACVSGANSFTMYTIAIENARVEELQSMQIPTEEDNARLKLVSYIPKDQQLFRPYQTNMRILKSSIISDKFPQHCLALAALVHNRLQFVELWNSNISQRISFLSRYLLRKSDCEMENENAPISFDDVRSSFVIDNEFLCHIVFVKNIQGPIFSTKRTEIVGVNLKNALTMFFKSCQQVVISFPSIGKAFAIWKENGVFYLFGINRIQQEIFVISSPTLANFFDNLLEGTNPDNGLNNWYEMRSVSISIVPIKEGVCKPLKTVQKIVEGPLASRTEDYFAVSSKEPHYYDHLSEKPEGKLIKFQPKEFLKVADGVEILYSKRILGSHRFYGTKDFFPSLQAACVEASVLSRVKSPSLWTKKTLENILSAGINLYINIVAVKGTANLEIVDFKGNFYLSNQKLEVSPLMPTVQRALKDVLLMCLTCILRKYHTGYLYTENFCFTLILENSDCYLYYPGSSERLCEKLQSESSCLIKFCRISDLLDSLLSIGEISLCENVCIGPILCKNYY